MIPQGWVEFPENGRFRGITGQTIVWASDIESVRRYDDAGISAIIRMKSGYEYDSDEDPDTLLARIQEAAE